MLFTEIYSAVGVALYIELKRLGIETHEQKYLPVYFEYKGVVSEGMPSSVSGLVNAYSLISSIFMKRIYDFIDFFERGELCSNYVLSTAGKFCK